MKSKEIFSELFQLIKMGNKFKTLRKYIIFLPLIILAVGCESNNNQYLDIKKTTIDSILVIGKADTTAEYIFSRPNFVCTDSHNDIFVAEQMGMKIRRYNSSGKFLNYIGSRGRGPGEFENICCMFISKEDTLIVFDMFNARISFFNTEGKLIRSQKLDFKKILWPRKIVENNDNNFVMIFKIPKIDEIIHVFKGNFGEESYGFRNNFLDDVHSTIIDVSLLLFGGDIASNNNGDIIYSPYIYMGKVYLFKKYKKEWGEAVVLKGYNVHKAFEEVDPNSKPLTDGTKPWTMHGYDAGKQYAANIYNQSVGLFVMNNGNIIHFLIVQKNQERIFGYELFNPNGKLLSFNEIESVPSKGITPAPIRKYVKCKDKDDNFYLVDLTKYPEIMKFKAK